MDKDQQLRDERLVFYRQDMEKIEAVFQEFLELSGSLCAMLVDKDGHLITQAGHTMSYDPDTISALVAGSFAATCEMARLLGEEEFSLLFHQGKKESIQLALVGDRSLIAIVFDVSTTLGLVRLYSAEMVAKLVDILEKAKKRPQAETLAVNFGAVVDDNLDGVFGG